MAKISIEMITKKSRNRGWTQMAKHFGCSVEDLKTALSRTTKGRRETLTARLDRNERDYHSAQLRDMMREEREGGSAPSATIMSGSIYDRDGGSAPSMAT